MAYTVLIVDDQNIPRKLFEMIVGSSPDYDLMYSLDTASVAHIYCSRYKIDLVIMDIVMNDGSSGLEEARRIKADSPSTKLLLVTSMPEVSFLQQARAIGVESFWYKEVSDVELLDVMNRTMAGEHVYPEQSPTILIGQAKSSEFTRAELRVLREMTTGASNQQIADALYVDVSTVKTHISNMLQKTGFSNRTELAIEARIQGLVIGQPGRKE